MRIRLHPWAGVALTLVLAVALAIAGLVASPRTASQVAPADTSVTRREPEPQADSPQRQDDKAEQASDREASEGEPAQTPPAQDEPQASEPAGQDGEPPAEEASVADDSGPQDAPSPVEAREHTESEVLISVDPQASAAEVEELLARMPGLVPQSVSEEDLRLGAVLVQLEPGVSVEDA